MEHLRSSSLNDESTGKAAELIGISNGHAKDSGAERLSLSIGDETETSGSVTDDKDLQLWLPPETENQENDMEGSVANYDDDDDEEYDNGMKWGEPSSLSSFGEGGNERYRYKEAKKKAMDEVMNGKFKAIVSQLLKSTGVSSSGENSGNWVDIVTSLSWEAASFVKPSKGKDMDPDGYVKVKCIATGCRSESQLIKGMVFKKHAAHKHMPTNYKNPRLLLIQGALDLSLSGLSSFDLMKQEQEKDTLNSIVETIEMCHPNVVLVEKTVSRDIQECILAKGMTLVFDMKLNRLQRVSRCIGSPILSSDTLTGQNLRQCESFHFEKFVEEHDVIGENGKRPRKTLMFLEGCPTSLGCTILLKGTNSEELKKIKFVVQYAVLVAYHLILETSFLLDQRAMFSTMENMSLTDQKPSVASDKANFPCPGESNVETDLLETIDIPISSRFHDEGSHELGLENNDLFSYEPYNPVLKRTFGDSFSLLSTSPQSVMHLNGKVPNGELQSTIQVLSSPKAIEHSYVDAKGSSEEEKDLWNDGAQFLSAHGNAPLETQKSGGSYEDQMQSKDDISTVTDAESILVLMSRRNTSSGIVCEQSHFSHIKFYRNFDVPLGKFLRDKLLNQKLLCDLCNEPPEAHIYCYAHHNKQLTIQVRRFPMKKRLPGEAEGKLWMWSRCGHCKPHNRNSNSTKRVLISAAARGLSFGKFLALSLSNYSSFSRTSGCGHYLHKDFLYFFGLGPMVAMLRYSPVEMYSVSLPPQKLKFSNSINGELLRKDFEYIYAKGILMFLEIEKTLKEISSLFLGSKLNLQGTLKEFSDIEEMLKLERHLFEVNSQSIAKNWKSDEAVYKLVSFNQIKWELFLEACVWDRRLYLLLSSDFSVTDTKTLEKPRQEQTYLENGTPGEEASGVDIMAESGKLVIADSAELKKNLKEYVDTNDSPTMEIPIEGEDRESAEQGSLLTLSAVTEDIQDSRLGIKSNGSYDQVVSVRPNVSILSHAGDENPLEKISLPVPSGKIVPINRDLGDGVLDSILFQRDKPPVSLFSNLENYKEWIWTPFSEIREECMKDLQKVEPPKFEPINNHAQGSRVHDLIIDEGSRLHIPLGTENYIVTDYEDELSSIIACALALLKDLPPATEHLYDDANREKEMDAKAYEYSRSMSRLSSLSFPYWSSFGSIDSDSMHSFSSISSEDSLLSSNNGLITDLRISLIDPHPVISMGMRKLPGKGKYSVVPLYAREFQDLRRQCCPSELDYIASLSRCRNWDAKGGKSKSFFAKTLDDRFIIKEIKRIEYESFMKFAQQYFTYMKECFELGNPSCLAKIFGIYQVIVRQPKSGKEIKHDLMVMENLTFGQNITRQYDLKGALHARFSTAADGSGDVLLDQNFVNDMNVSPLYVSTKAKQKLQRAVWNDTKFLELIKVMDYSLLVGVDTQQRVLVCGIIDYLRQYTWDKQLESWVKSSLVVPKNLMPTVISPKEYKMRFRKFITTHFLSVPDYWCSPVLTNQSDNDDSSGKKSQGQEDDNDTSRIKSLEQRHLYGLPA